jgi:hypothetical protein
MLYLPTGIKSILKDPSLLEIVFLLTSPISSIVVPLSAVLIALSMVEPRKVCEGFSCAEILLKTNFLNNFIYDYNFYISITNSRLLLFILCFDQCDVFYCINLLL